MFQHVFLLIFDPIRFIFNFFRDWANVVAGLGDMRSLLCYVPSAMNLIATPG